MSQPHIQTNLQMQVNSLKKEIEQLKETNTVNEEKVLYLTSALNAFPDLYFQLDADGTIKSFLCGDKGKPYVSPDVFLGKKMQDMLPPEVSEVFMKTLHKLNKSPEPVINEYSLDEPDGTHWYETLNIRFQEKDRLVIVRDISSQKKALQEKNQMELQFQHAQKLESLGVLAGGIAHDFNNLLVGILGYSDLALMKAEPNSPIAEYLEQIQNASERAAELCSQMLAYSGRGKFVITSYKLSDIVEEMVHLLRIAIRKEVVLDLLLSKRIPRVKIDLSQIRQVIMNLVINASESMEINGGLLTIKTTLITAKKNEIKGDYSEDILSEGNYVCLEVTDTGEGMNEETRKKIFDPFYTTKFTGRGLGLAAVLGIVRGHNGIIQVMSEQGKGSTFKVYLPVENSENKPDQDDETTQSAENSSAISPGLILVVDDEEENRNVISKMLDSAGYEVILACDGLEALKIFNKEHSGIQAVLLDLTLPRLSGNQVFEEMKKINPKARIVLTSGFDEQEVSDLFNETGFAGFIQKPFTTSNLIDEFNKILE